MKGDFLVLGRPLLLDPGGDDRLVDELAELLAETLVADLRDFPKGQESMQESMVDDGAMVVSPPVTTMAHRRTT